MIGRRDVIGLLGAALTAPQQIAAQSRTWRVGLLHPGPPAVISSRLAAFREGLGSPDGGGEALVLVGVAQERIDELPALAADLVSAGTQAICAVAASGLEAALSITQSIPIIGLDLESDPVGRGWAASLARPGRNVSGVFLDMPEFNAKCVELLREASPRLSKLAILWHPPSGSVQLTAARTAASAVGLTFDIYEVNRLSDVARVFEAVSVSEANGVLMLSAPIFGGRSSHIAELALRYRLPAINQFPDFAEHGGLVAYGPDLQQLFRQAGSMVRKALLGLPIGQLPIDRPVRFRLVFNMRTARLLGLDPPASMLARADEVIE